MHNAQSYTTFQLYDMLKASDAIVHGIQFCQGVFFITFWRRTIIHHYIDLVPSLVKYSYGSMPTPVLEGLQHAALGLLDSVGFDGTKTGPHSQTLSLIMARNCQITAICIKPQHLVSKLVEAAAKDNHGASAMCYRSSDAGGLD